MPLGQRLPPFPPRTPPPPLRSYCTLGGHLHSVRTAGNRRCPKGQANDALSRSLWIVRLNTFHTVRWQAASTSTPGMIWSRRRRGVGRGSSAFSRHFRCRFSVRRACSLVRSLVPARSFQKGRRRTQLPAPLTRSLAPSRGRQTGLMLCLARPPPRCGHLLPHAHLPSFLPSYLLPEAIPTDLSPFLSTLKRSSLRYAVCSTVERDIGGLVSLSLRFSPIPRSRPSHSFSAFFRALVPKP